MVRKLLAAGLALAGLAISACGGRGSGPATGQGVAIIPLPQINPDVAVWATVPKDTIGEELPSEGVGSIRSTHWKTTLGGYTQQRYAQALGFKPHLKITILNLSHSIEHTFDVVKEIKGPPALFPKNPKLPKLKQGGSDLQMGYASGIIKPGKSVTVTLTKPGIFLFGCAFHYHSGMHGLIVVAANATPGPQGTPPRSTPSSSPTVRSSYDP